MDVSVVKVGVYVMDMLSIRMDDYLIILETRKHIRCQIISEGITTAGGSCTVSKRTMIIIYIITTHIRTGGSGVDAGMRSRTIDLST